jgi:hypothetical protein
MLNFELNERSHNLRPLVFYLPLIVLFMAFAAVLSWPMPELAFRSDSSPVSWLSSAQLWAMVVLSIRLSLDRALPLLLGMWLAIAMAALAFDEQFMFHEQWKYGCSDWFALCRFYWVIEFPTLMVCIVGFLTTLWLYASVPRGLARWQLWVAIGIGLFSLSMDLLHFSNELAPYEEGFEVLAEAFYVSFLLGLQPAKNGSQVEDEGRK